MDRSRMRPLQKRGSSGDGRTTDRSEAVRDFLADKLPPGKAKQADYLADALLKAGTRYDRYAAGCNRIKWENYTARRNRLERIAKSIQIVMEEMAQLDLLSRDDLSTRVDPIKLESLMGSLLIVGKTTGDLAAETQKSGPRRDLAEERWILELADIYENAFSKRPSVWRSPDDRRMSDFYRLLELSRPETFPRHGKLSRRQIDRILSQRRPTAEKLSQKPRHDQKLLVPMWELLKQFPHASEEQLSDLRDHLKARLLELLKNKFPDIPEENLREQLPDLLERLEVHGT